MSDSSQDLAKENALRAQLLLEKRRLLHEKNLRIVVAKYKGEKPKIEDIGVRLDQIGKALSVKMGHGIGAANRKPQDPNSKQGGQANSGRSSFLPKIMTLNSKDFLSTGSGLDPYLHQKPMDEGTARQLATSGVGENPHSKNVHAKEAASHKSQASSNKGHRGDPDQKTIATRVNGPVLGPPKPTPKPTTELPDFLTMLRGDQGIKQDKGKETTSHKPQAKNQDKGGPPKLGKLPFDPNKSFAENIRDLGANAKPLPPEKPKPKIGLPGVTKSGGKYIANVQVAGLVRTVSFDKPPQQKDLVAVQEKYLARDYPKIFQQYQTLKKQYGETRAAGKKQLDAVDPAKFNLDFGSNPPDLHLGLASEAIGQLEHKKRKAAFETFDRARKNNDRARFLLNYGQDVAPSESEDPGFFGSVLELGDRIFGAVTKGLSKDMRPAKRAVEAWNKYANPAIDAGVNIQAGNYSGAAQTYAKALNGDSSPGLVSGTLNPGNWSTTKLLTDPDAYRKTVDEHLMTGNFMGFEGDVLGPATEILSILDGGLTSGKTLMMLAAPGEVAWDRLMSVFVKQGGQVGTDGLPVGWRLTQAKTIKELEQIASKTGLSPHARAEAAKMAKQLRQGIREGKASPLRLTRCLAVRSRMVQS